jgi:hypothetical protein
VLLKLGDKITAFTWLGRLHNLSLEGLLTRRGVAAKAGSFSIHFRGVQPNECLVALQAATRENISQNPLLDLPVEKVVDLGPYFELLTEQQQRKARGDWFQAEVLRDFAAHLEDFRVVERDCPLGVELSCVAAI